MFPRFVRRQGCYARVAEEARLESVYTPKGYQEFESPSLRKRHEARRIAPGFYI